MRPDSEDPVEAAAEGTIEVLRSRPRPREQLDALLGGGWPAFIHADAVAAAHVPRVRQAFADLEVVLLQDEVPAAAAWGVPIAWDGDPAHLPAGYTDSLVRATSDHDTGAAVDTLVICAAQVHPHRQGARLARAVLSGLIAHAGRLGLHRVLAPLRPTAKHRYPLTPIEDYATWTRPDGAAFDPWLRTHQRMGASVVATSTASQAFTGSVAQWQDWSGLVLPASGTYVVPDALEPLHLDVEADRGTCTESGIWARHR